MYQNTVIVRIVVTVYFPNFSKDISVDMISSLIFQIFYISNPDNLILTKGYIFVVFNKTLNILVLFLQVIRIWVRIKHFF